MNRKHLKRKPACSIHYGYSQAIKGLQIRDFEIVSSLHNTVGRINVTAAEIGVTSAYLSQRTGFLTEKKVVTPRRDLHYCGLDVEMYLVLYSDEGNRETGKIMEQVNNSLIFPHARVFIGNRIAFARITMPSRWVTHYLHELSDLGGIKGEWWEKGARIITVPIQQWEYNQRKIKYTDMGVKETDNESEQRLLRWKLD